MKKYASLILSPIAVMLLAGITFSMYQLFPFGQNSLSWCDMNQQVIPILLEFKDILSGQGDLFLNMSNAGGMNFWGVFLFFISSPFSFLVAFVDKADLMTFMNIMVVLKMMVCAVTACLFLRGKFPHLGTGATSALGVMYAFCGYTMMFYQNVVWLDMMYLFPLLLIGIDRLLTLRRPLVYCITLSAVVVVNFYLSYMVVLFILLGVSLYLLLCIPQKERAGAAALFGVASLVSALATAVVWLPALQQYLSSARGNNLLQSLASGNFFSDIFTTLPVLFCTAIIFSCLPFLSLREERRSRKLKWVLVLFLLMLIPLVIEPINKMWHTGSYQAFPVRYGYIPIFLGLIAAAAVLSKPNHPKVLRSTIPVKAIVVCDLLLMAGTLGSLLFFHQEEMGNYTRTLWGSKDSFTYLLIAFLAAFVCYFVIVYLYKFQRISRRMCTVAICILLSCECIFNASVYMGTPAHDVVSYQQVVALADQLPQDGFYRVKAEKKYYDANMTGALGYNSLAHYTSLNSERYLFAMKKLGYSSYWMEVNSNNGTLLTDALLCNRYTICPIGKEDPFFHTVYEAYPYQIVENSLYLPMGLKISADLDRIKELPNGERIATQEFLYSTLLNGKGDLFTRYEPQEKQNLIYGHGEEYLLKQRSALEETSSLTYHIPVVGQQTLYFDCFDELSNKLKEAINDSFQILVNGKVVEKSYPNQRTNGLLTLGTFQDEEVEVTLLLLKDVTAKSFGVYGLDVQKLTQAVEQAEGVEVSVNGTTLTASCTAEEGQSLALALPYDEGYTATVNGKETEVRCINDAFIGIELQPGENQITLHYMPSGFLPGAVLSAIGLLLIVLLWSFCRRGKRLPKIMETIFFVPLMIISFLAFAFLYLFPVGVYLFY